VRVEISGITIKREYNQLNGLAGILPFGLYNYLKTAWFVSAIEKEKACFLSTENDFTINDNFSSTYEPTESDQLSWGVDWIDAERVWGGEEDAHDVIEGNPAGEYIKVAIIDSGIDYSHEDLNDNYVAGFDFVNNDSDPMDDSFIGHGTHVAGIVGAEDNDAISVIGVAPLVSLYGIKVIDEWGEALISDIVAGIDWAVDNQMDIINLSLGAPWTDSTLEQAINRAWDRGIIVVAAAGNHLYTPSYNYTSVFYPAKYEKSLAIANLAPYPSSDNPFSVVRNSRSCTGPELDFSAPGTSILSTCRDNSYIRGNGTSMAAPMVTGTCALILSVNSSFSPYDVKDILIATAGDLGAQGHDNEYGHGQINAWTATEEAKGTLPSDSDNDGLFDREEMQLGTDRLNADPDNDGLNDYEEVKIFHTNPFCSDTDHDGLKDKWEIDNNFDPLDNTDGHTDHDNDGINTGDEVSLYNTDYLDSDTDNDGLTDGQEVYGFTIPTITGTIYTDPTDADTDGDGLSDSVEVAGFTISGVGFRYTNPTMPDTDGDGLHDGIEKNLLLTDPRDTDTDNDGYTDFEEFNAGTDPTDPMDYPGGGGWFDP
jgi:hypothetical protein